ncbi:hypothetical protein EYF80_058865 [Liparis tanakae]|uniref:Uncharacterized protein n=1 Tax=Liparis tanakae TaxID=230148 RepID=A0A4Z2ERR9_9TELE|nr:hypothetical protein EYF80_058865 [Liparis tanakae]
MPLAAHVLRSKGLLQLTKSPSSSEQPLRGQQLTADETGFSKLWCRRRDNGRVLPDRFLIRPAAQSPDANATHLPSSHHHNDGGSDGLYSESKRHVLPPPTPSVKRRAK